jgi:hypothetical protein
MGIKKLAGVIAVLLVSVGSAHAQLAGPPSTMGGFIPFAPTASLFEVYFDLTTSTTISTIPAFTGGGSITFDLSSAADVTFTGRSGDSVTLGVLTGPGIPVSSPLVLMYNMPYATKTLDLLGGGPYNYYVAGTSYTAPGQVTVDITASPVPEPQTYAMLLVGLAAIGVIGRRRVSLLSRTAA